MGFQRIGSVTAFKGPKAVLFLDNEILHETKKLEVD